MGWGGSEKVKETDWHWEAGRQAGSRRVTERYWRIQTEMEIETETETETQTD